MLLAIFMLLNSLLGAPAWAKNAPEPRAEAREAAAGLATVDSLLGLDDAGLAVTEAQRQFTRHGDDPLYGWQIEGRLGLALLRDGRAAAAVPHLEALLARNPTDPEAHRNLALALTELGRRGRALTEYQLVVELAPGNHVARLEYGRRLQEFRDFARALGEFEVARQLCGGCLEAERAVANLHLDAGDFTAAVEPLRRVLELAPSPVIERMLLIALSRSGDSRGVLDRLAAVPLSRWTVEQANLAVAAESDLGISAVTLQLVAGLDAVAPASPALDPEVETDAGLWGRAALHLLERGELDAGLIAARQAVALDKKSAVFRNNLVVILLALGRDEEAAREWENVLALDPSLRKKEAE